MNLLKTIAFVTTFFIALNAHAELDIQISGGGAQQIPIAITPFGDATSAKNNIGDIVAADLKRSGLFRVLETRGMANLPTTPAQVKYAEWAALQAQALTVGRVEPIAGGRLKVSFQLYLNNLI